MAQFYQAYTVDKLDVKFFGTYTANTHAQPAAGLANLVPLPVMFSVKLHNNQIPIATEDKYLAY